MKIVKELINEKREQLLKLKNEKDSSYDEFSDTAYSPGASPQYRSLKGVKKQRTNSTRNIIKPLFRKETLKTAQLNEIIKEKSPARPSLKDFKEEDILDVIEDARAFLGP